MSPDTLVVMARRPERGQVKTRLARTLGDAAACELYTAFMRDIRARLTNGTWRLVWAVTPAGTGLADIFGGEVEILDQRGADLGERMHHCFADLFAAGARRVVMIGADAPHLGRDTIAAAFAALEQNDAVLAPTRDGGYCLVGLRRLHDIFAGIPMGTAAVLRLTRERAARLGLAVHLLPETFDIDEEDDLRELAAHLAGAGEILAETAAVLRRLDGRRRPT